MKYILMLILILIFLCTLFIPLYFYFNLIKGLSYYTAIFVISSLIIYIFIILGKTEKKLQIISQLIFGVATITAFFTSIFVVRANIRDKQRGIEYYLCIEYMSNINFTKQILEDSKKYIDNEYKGSFNLNQYFQLNSFDKYFDSDQLMYWDNLIKFRSEFFSDREKIRIANQRITNLKGNYSFCSKEKAKDFCQSFFNAYEDLMGWIEDKENDRDFIKLFEARMTEIDCEKKFGISIPSD